MVTLGELEQAHKEWLIALQEFEMAEPEFVEAAVYKLTAAEQKYNTLLRLLKEGATEESERILAEKWNRRSVKPITGELRKAIDEMFAEGGR
jgi:hypothetical protein